MYPTIYIGKSGQKSRSWGINLSIKKNKSRSPEISSLRIIGGRWRSRKISFAEAPGLRPTGERIRETLFNWLQFDIADKTILDPFAGSGALSLEAISRGAKKACLIEKNRKVFKSLESNFKLLDSLQYQLNNSDSIIFLDKQNNNPFDLVFLDPPFNQNLIPMTLKLLSQKNYLHNESQIYIESEYEITPTLLENHLEYDCRIRKQKKSGNVHYCLISLEVT